MSNEPTPIDELAEEIRRLPAEDRAVVLEALSGEQRSDRFDDRPRPTDLTVLRRYCEDHPEDPICGGLGVPERSRNGDADATDPFRTFLRNAPVGGGCTETWEYLSQYRGGR